MFKKSLSSFVRMLAAIGLMVGTSVVNATVIVIVLDTEFSGATEPDGTYTATLDDSDLLGCGADCVQITLSASLAAGEKVGEWLLNFDDTKDVTDLAFAFQSGPVATVSTGLNAFKADGDGFYDIQFAYANNFINPDTSVYWVTGVASLTVADFNFESCGKPTCPSAGDNETFTSAAHIQSLGVDGEESGWIGGNPGDDTTDVTDVTDVTPVSEPATALLLAAVLLGLGLSRRRQRR